VTAALFVTGFVSLHYSLSLQDLDGVLHLKKDGYDKGELSSNSSSNRVLFCWG